MVTVALLVVMILGGSWQVVANAEKHGGFFWWMDKNEEGTTMITAPEGGQQVSLSAEVEEYYNIEDVPEIYRNYVKEVFQINAISESMLDYIKVHRLKHDDTVSVFVKNNDDVLRIEIIIYQQEILRVRESYPGYTFEKELDDGGGSIDIFSRKELSGENTYLTCFYYGKEKYMVIGKGDEEKICDIAIEYRNVILNYNK